MFLTSDVVENNKKMLAVKENFYKPLCLDGYLTPLQRKKLREKRNTDGVISEETPEPKKPRPCKRKKERSSLKSKERLSKKKKTKEIVVPQVQCTAAKVVLRTLNHNDGSCNNRFFKTSSPNRRLEKASFRMPLVYNKSSFSKVGRYCVGSDSRKRRQFSSRDSSVPSTDVVENSKQAVDEASSEKTSSAGCTFDASNISENCDANEDSSDEVSGSPKERSVFDFDWPEDEQLLKRQEKARAVLRRQKEDLQSLKKEDKVEEQLKAPERKLYPIFYVAAKKQSKNKQELKSKTKTAPKKFPDTSKRGGGEQMIIDAGQREIGVKICPTCNMIYTIGQEEDERLHSSYHETYLVNLKFTGWKEENVIGEYTDGRIILVRKNDKAAKLKKIEDILMIANRDLGFPSSLLPDKPDLTFVLFISNSKQVAGFLIAEPISSACRVLLGKKALEEPSGETIWRIGDWYASSETVPVICGVNRIWVAHTFRRQRIASRMVDCLRCHFIHGHRLGIREFAFTDPSPDGREFAASYTGTDNFLVYK